MGESQPTLEMAPWRDTHNSAPTSETVLKVGLRLQGIGAECQAEGIGAEWPELGRLSLLGSILVLLIVLLHLIGPLRFLR